MLHDDPIGGPIREEALRWAVRAGDPAFDDWDGLLAWLEQDPAHGAAYDAVSAAAADAADAQSQLANEAPLADNDDEETGGAPRHGVWVGGAIAACLSVAVFVGLWNPGSGMTEYVTAPGETQEIALANGDTIALAGGSTLLLRDGAEDFARLETGQALFSLRAPNAAPFTVEAGDATLVDIGTVFDVSTGTGGLAVAVSEGAVVVNPDAQRVRLDPGDLLTRPDGSNTYTIRSIPLAQVGEWREGRVTFDQASLTAVAAELTRATGISFAAAPADTGTAISGSVLVGSLAEDPRLLGPLLGVNVRRDGQRWVIEPL